ncbi:hypothetical protein GJ700_13850 [Duganella sp. FT92W]|uniref:Lactate dehydrogenase n=1 Tax=Pseudoduganella rivuli TaxID=2666085 RepID=A0A7X2IMY0_9BURK|nr:hypothetical protein [Pseudoduganella rivuli]MRV72791.1 hypothetical protein [Pseudoduganella rivuli]
MRLPAAPAGRFVATGAAAAPPSAIVRLSPESLVAARQAQADDAMPPFPVRFKDVGAAMLRQFNTGAAVPATQAALPDNVDNKFTLGIVTRSGVKVDLTLASLEDGMTLQVSASAELSDAERGALSRLAEGFQAAIDGMAAGEPQIRLGALTRFDAKALQSVELHAEVKQAAGTQSLAFRTDDKQRKVSFDGPDGSAEVAVDTSQSASQGTKQQQAKAIDSYLKQFDQAVERGHGDVRLMTMFKDAFADMNRTSARDEARDTGLSLPGQWPLAAEDHAVLTGLADFSASVTQTPKWSNPLRSAEKDSFSYSVSQQTHIDGARRDERTVSQTQQARLAAQFHAPVKKGGALKLDVTPPSQTYEYHRIDDAADSNVELGYRDGRLFKAALRQSASQSERIQTYAMGKLVSDKTIPGQQTLVLDLMASLAPYQAGDDGRADDTRAAREARRQQALDALNDDMLLLAAPDALMARRRAVP